LKAAGWCSTDRSGLEREHIPIPSHIQRGGKKEKIQTAPTVGIRESKAFVVHNRQRDSRDLFLLPFLIPLFVRVSSSVLAFFLSFFFPSGSFVSLRRSVTRKAQSCFYSLSYGLLLLTLLFILF
jgi:hypothetical protein